MYLKQLRLVLLRTYTNSILYWPANSSDLVVCSMLSTNTALRTYVRYTTRKKTHTTRALFEALAERSPLLLRVLRSTSQSRGGNASTWDRVCRRYGVSTKERQSHTADGRDTVIVRSYERKYSSRTYSHTQLPLAGHEVSLIVSCIVAKRADETAYSGNDPSHVGALAGRSSSPSRHSLEGQLFFIFQLFQCRDFFFNFPTLTHAYCVCICAYTLRLRLFFPRHRPF